MWVRLFIDRPALGTVSSLGQEREGEELVHLFLMGRTLVVVHRNQSLSLLAGKVVQAETRLERGAAGYTPDLEIGKQRRRIDIHSWVFGEVDAPYTLTKLASTILPGEVERPPRKPRKPREPVQQYTNCQFCGKPLTETQQKRGRRFCSSVCGNKSPGHRGALSAWNAERWVYWHANFEVPPTKTEKARIARSETRTRLNHEMWKDRHDTGEIPASHSPEANRSRRNKALLRAYGLTPSSR